jgi:osmoprotectant transport system permease protein
MRLLAILTFLFISSLVTAQDIYRVGSKKFTESYVLGEIAKGLMERDSLTVEHKQGMGGTIILWQALLSGGIDMYPEYTGTITEEILKDTSLKSLTEIRAALEHQGIGVTEELGFNNTYALVMTEELADKLKIHTISDLRMHPELKVGVTHEFLDRKDGWKPLAQSYGLEMNDVRGVDHGLGYAALQSGQIDIKDAYSTDAKIAEYGLRVLEDDQAYFPQYKAVFLYRLVIPPVAIDAIKQLEGKIDEPRMTALNAKAEELKDYSMPAQDFLAEGQPPEPVTQPRDYAGEATKILGWTIRHLKLVGISMLLAVLVGIPLGIWASRPGPLSTFILSTTGVIQTIPSLALLALLVPIAALGISERTAILALFLYSLLPIVRNTASGLQDIPLPLRESAAALGLDPRAQLTKVYLPMASRSILAGIKTSAVINVGTATLAALIGVGGLGEPIISGLNLNDTNTILMGAVPAAVLALLVQFGFEALDRVIIPRGLRL